MTIEFALEKDYAVDDDKSENGTWVPFKGGVEMRIRSFGARKSREVREEIERPHAVKISRDVAGDELMEELAIEQICRAIVVDWRGVLDASGEEIACTYDNRKALFSKKSMKALLADVVQVAINQDTFNADIDEETVKNLPTS